MNRLLMKYKKYSNKFEVKQRKPLPYDFTIAFKLMAVIYSISTLFDLALTYITFHLTPDHFFRYELSHFVKMAFAGDTFYQMVSIFCFLFPLILCYYFPMRFKKKYGYHISGARHYLLLLFIGSGLHLFGGFTNFIYIINLNIIHP